jgi:uncharacterized protein
MDETNGGPRMKRLEETNDFGRRPFLKGSMGAAAGLAIAGPLQALAGRAALGAPLRGGGYGELVDKGDLALPRRFRYRVISRSGREMSDGHRTPTAFDGMAAFRGKNGRTVLIRNHENRRSTGDADEITVRVPSGKRYDSDPAFNAGCTKLVVSADRRLVKDFAVLGGTTTNCAGGRTPWGTWITCEEVVQDGSEPHGYIYEIDAFTRRPVEPVPVKAAGRFVHEAVAWSHGRLHLTEDQRFNAAFYRYTPATEPTRTTGLPLEGTLEALKFVDVDNANTDGWPVGVPFKVEWVTIENPNSPDDDLRDQAQELGAAAFNRTEGAWARNRKVYFDTTEGGVAGWGQIWEYDPREDVLTLIYESPGPEQLKNPDNLTVGPNRHLFLCEDSIEPQFIRGLTPDGQIYDFARAITNQTEFAGVTFDRRAETLFVNQFGDPENGVEGRTYAIWGPW